MGYIDLNSSIKDPVEQIFRAISDSQSKLENSIFDAFSHRMNSDIDSYCLREVISILSGIDDEWYHEHEVRLFNDLIQYLSEIRGKFSGEDTQSQELTAFIANISEYDGKGAMYNPFAGTGTYCIEMAGDGRFVGQEINSRTWAIGAMRLVINGKDPSSFYCEDSLRYWRGDEEKFDLIVATPPFALKAEIDGRTVPFAEESFITNSLHSLKDKGAAVGVFTSATTRRGGKTAEMRRELIERDKLEAVILLPTGAFRFTNIPTVILKISNRKKTPGQVLMVDGSSFFKKERIRTDVLYDGILEAIRTNNAKFVRSVSLDDIRANDYVIEPSRYFKEEISVPEGYSARPLSDYVSVVNGTRCSDSGETVKVANISALSTDPFDYELNYDALPEEVLSSQYRKITEPVLLFSKVRVLKPTYAKASEKAPLYVHSNVLAVKITDKTIYIPSLILALSKISGFETGMVIPHITQSTILDLKVLLPTDPAAQEAYFRSAEREKKDAQIRELGLEDVIQAQKTEFISVVRRRKHDLNNMLGDVRNSFSAVSLYLHSKGYDAELLDEDSGLSISQLFSHLESTFSSMSRIIRHLDDEEVYAEPEVIDLIPRLEALEKEGHANYTVHFSYDKHAFTDELQEGEVAHAFIKFGSVNLDRVFFNIIQNAERHGFTDPSRTDYTVEIELSLDINKACYIIRFKNNGKPLPEGMNTRRYGIRAETAGVTAGNGDGGAIVKSTIEHYGGKMELINQVDDVFPVCVELIIPQCDE